MKGITGNPVLDAYGRMAVTPVGAARPAEAAVEAGGSASAASTPAAEVTISSHARDMAAGGRFDAEKVEALKNSIAEGKFKIDSQNVARRMLDALG
jgi:flagellar biosynthesis anti-sigma factor FlgM